MSEPKNAQFERAKSEALKYLQHASFFAAELGRSRSDVFESHSRNLSEMATKIESASQRCLTSADFDTINKFLIDLIRTSYFEAKLSKFYEVAFEYSKSINDDNLIELDIEQASKDVKRFRGADKLANDVWRQVNETPLSYLAILGVALALIATKETYHNFLLEQLDQAVRKIESLAKYDLDDIFSVKAKVRRGDGYETDVNAIRTCFAHGYYEIKRVDDDFLIQLENNSHGWQFKHEYSRQDFFRFFADYMYLEGMRIQILRLTLMAVLMANHLLKL